MENTEKNTSEGVKIAVQNLKLYFGNALCLREISAEIRNHRIVGIIGPAGSGKTIFLRSLNRLNDLVPSFHVEGKVLLDGEDIYHPNYDVISLRRRVGMVFALPVPLPMSIRDNILYGPRLAGIRDRSKQEELIERSLTAAALWDEVKDRLHVSAFRLSGGQQQRLCLARVLAMEPEVILLDEPCSGLDPISTARIEEALMSLKERYTIVLVTNNTKQAARVSDDVLFFLMGELIEAGPVEKIFTSPSDSRTAEYVSGKFG